MGTTSDQGKATRCTGRNIEIETKRKKKTTREEESGLALLQLLLQERKKGGSNVRPGKGRGMSDKTRNEGGGHGASKRDQRVSRLSTRLMNEKSTGVRLFSSRVAALLAYVP